MAYHDVSADAIAALADGPAMPSVRKRDDIASGLMTLLRDQKRE